MLNLTLVIDRIYIHCNGFQTNACLTIEQSAVALLLLSPASGSVSEQKQIFPWVRAVYFLFQAAHLALQYSCVIIPPSG